MADNVSNRRWLPVIFFLAFLLRLAYIYQTETLPFANNLILDTFSEDRWGRETASGDWLGKEKGVFYTDPLYAYSLGIIYFIFGHDLLAARVAQALIDSGTCILIFFLGRKAFGPGAGLLSSVLAAVYGPFVYYQAFIMKSTLNLFLLTLFLLALLKAIERPGWIRWFLSGLSLGFVAMTRGNMLAFAPLVALYILFCSKNSSSLPHPRPDPPLEGEGIREWGGGGFLRRGIYISVFLSGLMAALLPVATRNYIYGNSFVLTAPSIGMNFYIGNNPSAVGVHTPVSSVRTIPEKEAEDAARIASASAGRVLNPSEVSSFWMGKGMEFAVNEPAAFLKLLGRKFLLSWNHYEVPDVYNYYLFREMAPILPFLMTFGIIAPLGITGMLISFKGWQGGRVLSGLALAYILSITVFYVTSRYRLPIVVILIPFSAHTIITLIALIEGRRFRKVFTVGSLVLASWMVVNLDVLDGDRYLSQSHTSLGNIYFREGKGDEAITEYRTALGLHPGNPDALNNLAYIYAEKGVALEEALSLVRLALRFSPESPEFLDTEAYIYIRMGRVEEAREILLKAISVDPGNSELSERLKSLPH